MRRAVDALLAVILLAACANNGAADASADGFSPRQWPCPAEWVASARGGCGPAVILCAPGGGARAHACDGIDITRPRPRSDEDGGLGPGFHYVADAPPGHRVGGPWPDEEWTPDAGISSCAPGWSRLADGTCDPNLRSDCGAGAEPLPGGTCTSTAESDCPSTQFADPGPAALGATLVHVDGAADPTLADGSALHPYATLATGLARAASNGWVLVAAGRYAEPLGVAAGAVHVVGQCAAHTSIAAPAGSNAVDVSGAGVTLEVRGVSLTQGSGVVVSRGARLTLRSVRIDGLAYWGIAAAGVGSTLDATDVVVARALAPAFAFGRGIQATSGATATLSRVVAIANRTAGVAAGGAGSRIDVSDSVVIGTMPQMDGTLGRGVEANTGASIACTRVLVADNHELGTIATGDGSALTLTDTIVRGTLRRRDGTSGGGIEAGGGSSVTCSRVLVTDNHDIGVASLGRRAVLAFSDGVVRRTAPRADGTYGHGVLAQAGGALQAARVIVSDNQTLGAQAVGANTILTLRDAWVRRTMPGGNGRAGRGIEANSGASVTCTRVRVDENHEVGVLAADVGTEVTMVDSVVRGTRPSRDGLTGYGIQTGGGAVLTCRRVLISENHGVGASVAQPGSALSLIDTVVRATRASQSGVFGHGLNALDGATMSCERVLVADSRESALVAAGSGTEVVLRDTIIDRVLPSARRGMGLGTVAVGGAAIDAQRLAVLDVTGAAIATIPRIGTTEGDEARTTTTDVFIRGVRSGTVEFSADGLPAGRAVAYGLYVGRACTVSATQATIDGGGYGFLNAGGSLSIRTGVITNQLDAAGARYGPVSPMQIVLVDVDRAGNARDDIIVDDALPQASALEPPTPVCWMPPCS